MTQSLTLYALRSMNLYFSRCDWTAAAAAARTAEYHNHDVDNGVEAFARKTDDVRTATHIGRAGLPSYCSLRICLGGA